MGYSTISLDSLTKNGKKRYAKP